MFDFYEKRKVKKLLHSRVVLTVLCIPVVLMMYAAYNAYEKKQETSERRSELSARLAGLEERRTELEQDIDMLNDPRGVEAELRSRYEVGKEGEEVVVFVEQIATDTENIQPVKKDTIWDKIVRTLF